MVRLGELDPGVRRTIAQRGADRGRVRGPRAAATADDRDAVVQQRLCDLPEVLRRRRIHEASTDLRRPSGVWPGDDRHAGAGGGAPHRPHDPQDLGGALAAVHAERVDAEGDHRLRDLIGRRPQEGPIVAGERRARDERDVRRDVARGEHALLELPQVALGLDHEQVDARVREGGGLLAVRGERILRTHPSVRLEADAQRAHRTRDDRGAGVARERDAGAAQLGEPVGEPVSLQAVSVRTERVREDEAGTGADERRVDLRHARRRPHVQLLHARVDGDPAGDQRRAHAAVREERPLGQEGSEGSGIHTCSVPPLAAQPAIARPREPLHSHLGGESIDLRRSLLRVGRSQPSGRGWDPWPGVRYPRSG